MILFSALWVALWVALAFVVYLIWPVRHINPIHKGWASKALKEGMENGHK